MPWRATFPPQASPPDERRIAGGQRVLAPGRQPTGPDRPGRPGLDGPQSSARGRHARWLPPGRDRRPRRVGARRRRRPDRRAGLRRAAGHARGGRPRRASSSPPRPPPTSISPWPRSSAAWPVLVEKPLAATVEEGCPSWPRRAPAACPSRSATWSASTRPSSSSAGCSARAGCRRVRDRVPPRRSVSGAHPGRRRHHGPGHPRCRHPVLDRR